MTSIEKTAFINAYCSHIAHLTREEVSIFLDKYLAKEDIDYSGDFVLVLDALGIWHEAIKFQLRITI
jgi:hypothetical protein